MGLFGAPKQVTVNDLVDRYAAVLERGPLGDGTLHDLRHLPAEKTLMKAALVAQAYQLGSESLNTLRAAFVSLANFQDDTRELLSRHAELAAEMTVLKLEFDARTKSLRDGANA